MSLLIDAMSVAGTSRTCAAFVPFETNERQMKNFVKDLLPPLVLRGIRSVNKRLARKMPKRGNADAQNLDLYWDPEMAAALETWGEGNAWNEIQLLLINAHGTALDIACGTGKVMTTLAGIKAIEVHGCDISDFLLDKAAERGIARERLKCCDATALPYPAKHFDYAYSIGSLEHFTEEGISGFMQQCRKVVKERSFHMIPVSRSNKDEGWITPWQSYFNNSTDWWVAKCKGTFGKVTVLDSAWQDEISVGKWLICEE